MVRISIRAQNGDVLNNYVGFCTVGLFRSDVWASRAGKKRAGGSDVLMPPPAADRARNLLFLRVPLIYAKQSICT